MESMMKKEIKIKQRNEFVNLLKENFILFILAVTCICVLGPVKNVKAATLEKVVSKSKYTASFGRDLTGDGIAERVTIIAKAGSYGTNCYQKLAVYVNGKYVNMLRADGVFWNFDVQYIFMSKSKQFIVITTVGADYYPTLNAIYRYDSKKQKLVQVLDFKFGRLQDKKK